MTLGEKIWRLRESRNMSQEELAEKLEVSRQTVSNWENDKAVLDAVKLAKLCTVFGVNADDMLNGEGIPPTEARERKNPAPNGRRSNRTFAIVFFAVIALLLIVIAAVGLIFGDDKVSLSSLITLRANYVWLALLALGIAALIGTVIAFLKKK